MAEVRSSLDSTGVELEKFERNFVAVASSQKIDENLETESTLSNWIDLQLLQEGQRFIRRNFFAIFFAHFISLVFLLCYAPVRLILLRTGRSNTSSKALKRYIGTLVHIKGWYESAELQPGNNRESGDITRIRVLHCRIARHLALAHPTCKDDIGDENPATSRLVEAIRADFEAGTTPVLVSAARSQPTISQLDMCVTQFCFMGFLYMFPSSFGIVDTKGLQGYVHIWALIGKRLGIPDRFNICLEQNFYTHALILKRILIPEVAQCDTDTVMLLTSLTSGIAKFIPFISLKALFMFVLKNVLKVQRKELDLKPLMTRYDALCYNLMNRCFNRWIYILWVRLALNGLLRLAIVATLYLRFPKSVRKNLAKKPHLASTVQEV